MSDQFPMPKTIENTPASPRDYAPKRGLEAVAEAVAPAAVAGYRPPPYTPPPPPYTPPQPGSQHTATIKDAIKKLTHREMREMVAAVFEAQKKLGGAATDETITRTELADVLDRFAYGE